MTPDLAALRKRAAGMRRKVPTLDVDDAVQEMAMAWLSTNGDEQRRMAHATFALKRIATCLIGGSIAEVNANRRRERRAAGQCAQCGTESAVYLCRGCKDKRNGSLRKTGSERKALGLCYYCNEHAREGHRTCDKHANKGGKRKCQTKPQPHHQNQSQLKRFSTSSTAGSKPEVLLERSTAVVNVST